MSNEIISFKLSKEMDRLDLSMQYFHKLIQDTVCITLNCFRTTGG